MATHGQAAQLFKNSWQAQTIVLSPRIEIPALRTLERRVDRPIARASAREVPGRLCNPFATAAERQSALSFAHA